MSDKPISAQQLFEQIIRLISDENDGDHESLIARLAYIQNDEVDNRMTLEGAVALASAINTRSDLIRQIHYRYKHEILQYWPEDKNEV